MAGCVCWEREAGRARTPIVAVTASAMVDECRRYTEAGMDDTIFKPVSAGALADVVARDCFSSAWAYAHPFNSRGATS